MIDAYNEIKMRNAKYLAGNQRHDYKVNVLDDLAYEDRHKQRLVKLLIKNGVSKEEARRRCGLL